MGAEAAVHCHSEPSAKGGRAMNPFERSASAVADAPAFSSVQLYSQTMNHTPSVDVFGLGHCCADYLCVLDPFPEKGKKGDVTQSLVIGEVRFPLR